MIVGSTGAIQIDKVTIEKLKTLLIELENLKYLHKIIYNEYKNKKINRRKCTTILC